MRLKGAVIILEKIARLRQPLPPFNLQSSHDIGKIWSYIKEESTKLDERLGFYIEILDDYISDISEIDATGQTFRYPYDSSNIKHLVEIPTINVGILFRRFSALESFLDSLENYLHELRSEHGLGTYTKNLSRHQLLQIANKTPQLDHWGNPEFKVLKEEIKTTYRIGSKELSEAFEKIKILYRSTHSGLPPPPLKFITQEKLYIFFDSWIFLNGLDTLKKRKKIETLSLDDTNAMRDAFQSIVEKGEKEEQIWPKIKDAFSIDQLADINALYESGDSNYPEHYPFHVDYYQNEFQSGSYSYSGGVRESLTKLLKKTNTLNRVLRCLYLVGHRDLAEALIEKYDLEHSLNWLELARANELFIDPCGGIIANCIEQYGNQIVQSESA